MARQKSPSLIRVEYYALRGLLSILQALPAKASRKFCRKLLQLIMRFMPKRRRLMLTQLHDSFPDFSASRCEAIADQSIDNLADGLSVFARIPIMSHQDIEKQVEVVGLEYMREAFQQGKGMITFTAHYGCWEMMAVYITRLFPLVSMVVRSLDNSRLDAMVTKIRGSCGGGVIDSRRVFRDGVELLRNNGVLGVVTDQNFHKGGVFIDFFARQAATNTLVPILARRTGCAVLPMHNVWHGDKIRIICEPPITLSANPNAHQAIHEDTQTVATIVEGWVRQDPGQWLWMHNRWKRKPPENTSAVLK
jgi:Kdo2-lipid IVA lauroyltransferase/acyltransferase